MSEIIKCIGDDISDKAVGIEVEVEINIED